MDDVAYKNGPQVLYSVYDNKTDLPVIIAGTGRECARAMGMSLETFRTTVCRCMKGRNRRWRIYKGPVVELEDDDEDDEGI